MTREGWFGANSPRRIIIDPKPCDRPKIIKRGRLAQSKKKTRKKKKDTLPISTFYVVREKASKASYQTVLRPAMKTGQVKPDDNRKKQNDRFASYCSSGNEPR